MTRLALTRRDRRVLTVGAVVIASLVVGARGVPAWLTWQRAARDAALEMRAELARAEASVRGAAAVRDSLAARDGRFVALAPALLNGDTPAAAAATLASLLSGAAATAGVRMGSVQVLADSAGSEPFTPVAVRGSVTGDIRGITAMLLALERGSALLAVRELAITQPAPAAPATEAEALRVELVVEGLALNRPSPSPRGDP